MATVKIESTFFGSKPFKLRVNVDKHGIFRIKLPDWSHGALGELQIEATTLDEAVREFRRLQDAYAKLLQEKRKVIRYVFQLQEKTGVYDRDKTERNDISFGIGKGFQFGVANVWEIIHRDADGKEISRTYEYCCDTDDETSDKKQRSEQPYPAGFSFGSFQDMTAFDIGARVIEWSPEREEWFVALCKAINTLIKQMKTLDDDQAELLERVASRKALGWGV